ncbi:hypothetical protein HD806DRAFT_529067 [Xylariaceae sp. AK1471]|nr:hypothetical protein HD806DRAFT_529067 [Xylariaceae sp. AK1471]
MGAKKKNDNKPKPKGDTTNKGGNANGGQEKKDSGKLKGGQAIVVRHILCTKHSKKEEALAEIKKRAVEDTRYNDNVPRLCHFDEVAKLYSEEKAKEGTENSSALVSQVCHGSIDADILALGGRIGLKIKGSLLADFEKVAYALKPEKASNGKIDIGEAKTEHGYHLIVVEERK